MWNSLDRHIRNDESRKADQQRRMQASAGIQSSPLYDQVELIRAFTQDGKPVDLKMDSPTIVGATILPTPWVCLSCGFSFEHYKSDGVLDCPSCEVEAAVPQSEADVERMARS